MYKFFVADGELFGLWGVLFASPIAGVLQAELISIWRHWHVTHPEQFEPAKTEVKENADKNQKGGPTSSE